MSTTNSFPTPASSVGGHTVNVTSIEEAEHKPSTSGMQGSAGLMEEGPVSRQAAEYRRTDHDRQPPARSAEVGTRDFASEQGHAMDPDAMDIDSEPPALRNLDLDTLQKELTSAFHLSKSCKKSPIATLAVQ